MRYGQHLSYLWTFIWLGADVYSTRCLGVPDAKWVSQDKEAAPIANIHFHVHLTSQPTDIVWDVKLTWKCTNSAYHQLSSTQIWGWCILLQDPVAVESNPKISRGLTLRISPSLWHRDISGLETSHNNIFTQKDLGETVWLRSPTPPFRHPTFSMPTCMYLWSSIAGLAASPKLSVRGAVVHFYSLYDINCSCINFHVPRMLIPRLHTESTGVTWDVSKVLHNTGATPGNIMKIQSATDKMTTH